MDWLWQVDWVSHLSLWMNFLKHSPLPFLVLLIYSYRIYLSISSLFFFPHYLAVSLEVQKLVNYLGILYCLQVVELSHIYNQYTSSFPLPISYNVMYQFTSKCLCDKRLPWHYKALIVFYLFLILLNSSGILL